MLSLPCKTHILRLTASMPLSQSIGCTIVPNSSGVKGRLSLKVVLDSLNLNVIEFPTPLELLFNIVPVPVSRPSGSDSFRGSR